MHTLVFAWGQSSPRAGELPVLCRTGAHVQAQAPKRLVLVMVVVVGGGRVVDCLLAKYAPLIPEDGECRNFGKSVAILSPRDFRPRPGVIVHGAMASPDETGMEAGRRRL